MKWRVHRWRGIGPSYLESPWESELRARRRGRKRRFQKRAAARQAELHRKWHRRWRAAGYEFRLTSAPALHFEAPGFRGRDIPV